MKTLLAVLVCLSFTGCTGWVGGDAYEDPGNVRADLSATYFEGENRLSLTAKFTATDDDGQVETINAPGDVLVNSEALAETSDSEDRIFYQLDVSPLSSHVWGEPQTFTFTDEEGAPYTNTLMIPSPVAVTTPAGSLFSRSGGGSIGWTTPDSLAPGESLTVYMRVPGDRDVQVSSDQPVVGDDGFVALDPESLSQFSGGNVLLSVCREREEGMGDAPAGGGTMSASYCSSPVTVTLIP